MKELDQISFREFISSQEKVLITFSADWCGPCKAMQPLLEKVESYHPGKIGKINVDLNRDLANEFGIKSIPTMIIFQENKVIEKKVGTIKSTNEIVLLLN